MKNVCSFSANLGMIIDSIVIGFGEDSSNNLDYFCVIGS